MAFSSSQISSQAGRVTSVVGNAATVIAAGAAITNAFLVMVQKLDYDVQGSDNKSLLFAYREDDSVQLSSDITDHYTERKNPLQDQIALRPEIITLKGYIGELSDQTESILKVVQTVESQLTVLAPFMPGLTAAALQAFSVAQQVYNTGASAVTTVMQAVDLLTGGDLQTKQQKAYSFLKSRWKARMLFTVQTPWELFKDMAIMELRATQENDTDQISDFTISFKQMNFADVTYLDQTVKQTRLNAQASGMVNQGIQSPPDIGPVATVLGDQSAIQSTVFA